MVRKSRKFLTWPKVASIILFISDGAYAADLTIRIDNMDSNAGQVVVAIFSSDEDFLKQPIREDFITTDNNEVVFAFKDIIPGDYAISAFHDRNANGKLDTNFLGIPSEPFGFSNNPKILFGPPSFTQSKINILDQDISLNMKLHSF